MLYTIDRAAQIAGVSPQLIRYAEARGYIPQAQRLNGLNGARVYDEDALSAIHAWRIKANESKRSGTRQAA